PPLRQLYDELDHLLQDQRLLTAGIAQGYPYADVPEMGMACLAISDGHPGPATEAADRLALATWQAREQLQAGAAPPRPAGAPGAGPRAARRCFPRWATTWGGAGGVPRPPSCPQRAGRGSGASRRSSAIRWPRALAWRADREARSRPRSVAGLPTTTR